MQILRSLSRIGHNCHIKLRFEILWKCEIDAEPKAKPPAQLAAAATPSPPTPLPAPAACSHSHSVAPKRSWVENRDFLEMFLSLCRGRRVDVAAAVGQDSFLRKLLTSAALEYLLNPSKPLPPFPPADSSKNVQPNAVRKFCATAAQDRCKMGASSLHLLFKSFASSRHN